MNNERYDEAMEALVKRAQQLSTTFTLEEVKVLLELSTVVHRQLDLRVIVRAPGWTTLVRKFYRLREKAERE